MDIVKLISDKVKEVEANGTLEKIIEKHTIDCLNEIVKDSFKWRGEAKKAMEEALEGKLSVNLKDISLDRYHKIVSQIVEEELNGTVINDLRSDIGETVRSITGFLEKKEHKLSDVVCQFIENIDKSYDGDMDDDGGTLTLIVNESDSGEFHHIYIDREEDKDKYSCEVQIHLHNGKMYHAQAEGKPFSPFMIDNINGFEAFLFKLYCNNVKIVLDEDKCEVDYYREDYD